MDYDFNVLYYINMYKKSWKMILAVIVLFVLFAFFFSVFSPVTYVSEVTLLDTGGNESQSGSTVAKLLGVSAKSSTVEIINLIFKSRRMANDIQEYIKSDRKPGTWWRIIPSDAFPGVVVKGSDPDLTEKVANFSIQNLDKINMELSISSSRAMVKVLDPAVRGIPEPRQIPRKLFVSAMAAFLLSSFYIFFTDYIKKLKS